MKTALIARIIVYYIVQVKNQQSLRKGKLTLRNHVRRINQRCKYERTELSRIKKYKTVNITVPLFKDRCYRKR